MKTILFIVLIGIPVILFVLLVLIGLINVFFKDYFEWLDDWE